LGHIWGMDCRTPAVNNGLCGLTEFWVDLARSHGTALVNNLLLLSHGSGHQGLAWKEPAGSQQLGCNGTIL
jgi:hypothetical protein